MSNTLENSYKISPENSIKVCFDYVREDVVSEVLYLLGFGRNVDYYSSVFRNRILGNINPRASSYVISPVDSRKKRSRGYYNCTGLVAIGVDKRGGNISFLTHQNPAFILKDSSHRKMFEADLQRVLGELVSRSQGGSIEAAIVGGNYLHATCHESFKKDYRESVRLLVTHVMKTTGTVPTVVSPMLDRGFTDISVDTKNRRIIQGRWRIEDYTQLDNFIFDGNNLESMLPEFDAKCGRIQRVTTGWI